ncbi:MAG: hypothetical protein IKP33_08870 [Prevotella sp.]|nr:hypothetical protein [Prevotella sp.]
MPDVLNSNVPSDLPYQSGSPELTEIIRLLNIVRNNCMGAWNLLSPNANSQEVTGELIKFQNLAQTKFRDGRYDDDTRSKLEAYASGIMQGCYDNISYEISRRLPNDELKKLWIARQLDIIHENCGGIEWPYFFSKVDDKTLVEALIIFQNWANIQTKDGTFDRETEQRLKDFANWAPNLCRNNPSIDTFISGNSKKINNSRYGLPPKSINDFTEEEFKKENGPVLQTIFGILDTVSGLGGDVLTLGPRIYQAVKGTGELLDYFRYINSGDVAILKQMYIEEGKIAIAGEKAGKLGKVALGFQLAVVLFRTLKFCYASSEAEKKECFDKLRGAIASLLISAILEYLPKFATKAGAVGIIVSIVIAVADMFINWYTEGDADFGYVFWLGLEWWGDTISEWWNEVPDPTPLLPNPSITGYKIQPGWNVQSHVHGDYYDGPVIGPDPGRRRF